MDALQRSLDTFREAGAALVAISPQLPSFSRELTRKHRLAFPILLDEGNSYAQRLGLRHGFSDALREWYLKFGLDVAASNGEPSWTLPMPARYLIAQDGTVHYARVHPDYKRRPEPAETLEALQQLSR